MSWKKIVPVLAVVVIVSGFLWWWQVVAPEREAQKYIKEIEKEYVEDTFGGTTPEETLALFIESLEVGDMELASKYFVMERQAEWLERLSKLSDEQILEIAENISLATKKDEIDDTVIFKYEKYVEDGFVIVGGEKINIPSGNYLQTIEIKLNPYSQIWKIDSL